MDWSVLHSLNDFFWHHDGVEDPVLWYVQAAEALFLGMLLLVIAFAHGPRFAAWRRAAVAAGLSAGLALALGKVISEVVLRARPFVAHPHAVHLFAPHAADPGFPSDHATASFAIAIAVVMRKRWWGYVLIVAAAVLSVGRVALGYHYPSDVLAGAALGAFAALVLYVEPLRRWVDAISDRAGGLWDKALSWAFGRLGAARTAQND